tara:strand:- start:866 stop:1660 length:795 start_codon:yes stop_codon:yes gene_type:complete
MSKPLVSLAEELLENIRKIDAALAAKQITPESADILRRQAAAQSEASFKAAKAAEAGAPKTKDGREMIEIGGVSVPKGGLRNFILGTGLLGAGTYTLGPGIVDKFTNVTKSPTATTEGLEAGKFTADIASQENIAQRAMNRNVNRRFANAFIGPIRAGQQLINLIPNEIQGQDMPLMEYFKYEDPNQTVRERVEVLDQQMDKSNQRKRQEIQTTKQGEAQVVRTEGEADIEARQIDVINNYLQNRNIFGGQNVPTRPNRGNYQY